MKQRLTGLAALLVLAGILIGLPILLIALGWGTLPAGWAGWRLLLTRPDDGTLLVLIIKVVAWAAWIILAGSILVELVATLRGSHAPHLPGLAWTQLPARQLIAASALLFVVPTSTTLPAPSQASTLSDPAFVAAAAPDGATSLPGLHAQQRRISAPVQQRRHTVTHTVRRGESLWSIAADHLGAGERYTEIVAVNRRLLRGNPHFLQVGWTLTLPTRSAATPKTSHARSEHTLRYQVRPGDTLSDIAHTYLGDADRYPEIFHASRHLTQPDGRHLSDPDLIVTGWTLHIPHATRSPVQPKQRQPDPAPAPVGQPLKPDTQRVPPPAPSATTTPSGTATPSGPATASPEAPPNTNASPVADPSTGEAQPDPGWLVTGLVGAGGLLGGSMFIALRRRRQAQFRARRPGRTIAPPPTVVAPVEKTLSTAGAQAIPTVTNLDAALRMLAQHRTSSGQAMPKLDAVEIRPGQLWLHLAEPCPAEQPWTAVDDRTWTLATPSDLDNAGQLDTAEVPAPYPLLATLGEDDSGAVWLANLEQLGSLHLAGDTDYSDDFARYLVAEMAVAPWAQTVRVDCFGIAEQAVDIEPSRLHHHPIDDHTHLADRLSDATATLQRARRHEVDVPTGRAGDLGGDTWPAWLILIGIGGGTPTATQLTSLASEHPGHIGTAVITTSDQPGAAALRFTPQGRLQAPRWKLNLIPVGLTADEAQGCSVLLAACDTPDQPMPIDNKAEGWRAHCDQAGAPRPDTVLPRDLPVDELPEPAHTVINEPDQQVMQVAATTEQDLAQLAPWVPQQVAKAVEESDPTLDTDLAAWRADNDLQPRLWLLGPITARTSRRGNPVAAKQRRAFYTELLTYLALHPNGATTDQLCDAFTIKPAMLRKYMGVVRDWLGNTTDGTKHLPEASQSPAAAARGIGVYQLQQVLVDADLFRRLRQRGTTRGPEGLTDLRAALSLVTGEPFEGRRPSGWAWLADGDRIDHHLTCAIIDTAHLVTAASLAAGDLSAARAAATVGHRAAPYDDIPGLDLAAVLAAEGNQAGAHRVLTDEIGNRHSPAEAPQDLSPRSVKLATKPGWLKDGRVA